MRSFLRTTIKIAILCLLSNIKAQGQTTETMSAGSFIINMGVTPQTVGNGLKPYGMIYDLVKNYYVPIKWAINPTKSKDGADFNYNGVDYIGGPFIIPAEYRNSAINARITYWQSQGVVGITTTSSVTVPIYTTILVMPEWTMDKQNGSIAVGYFTNAGIPSTAYGGPTNATWKTPAELDCCDDLFVMPHADPTWATHQNLLAWNLSCNGSIWLGCHAGSALEDMFNPATPAQQTNFLAEKTGVATGGGPYSQNALLLWGNHTAGTLPYTYDYHSDPIMQFIGTIDIATQNGSEQIYIPLSAGWRPTTKVGVYDPDHAQKVSTNPEHRAAVLAYGRGLGDTNRGFVMLEASHALNKATGPANIAAQRAFFNFSMLTALEKAVLPEPIPILLSNDTLYSGIPADFTYNLPSGFDPANYTVQWTASCGGSFSPTSTQRNVTFTPPTVTSPTPCFVNIEISDACGRRFSNSKQVLVICALSASATLTHPTCSGGATGSISLSVSGGPSPYTYNWSRVSPAATGSDSGTTISGLVAGTYNITVTAANGCATSFSATLNNPTALSASNAVTNVPCNGTSTGAIDLTATGGTGALTYNWGGGVSTEDRTNIAAGTYGVTVTDANGCTATSSATVTQPAAIVLNPAITNVSCFGQSNGAISLAPTGGTGSLTYAWSDGPTTQNRTGLTGGNYTVTATDANSCTKSATITITQPAAALSLNTSITNVVCGSGTGAINLIVTGGTSPYAYAWADGPTTEDRSGLAAGTYTVTVTDNNGCTSTTAASVTSTAGASLSVDVTNVLCFGQSNGAINLTATGPSPFTYNWGGGVTSEDRSGLAAGTYTVTVTASNGCTASISGMVAQPSAALGTSGSTTTNINCYGTSTGAINLSVSGGTGPFTFDWEDIAGTSNSEDRTALAAGTYSVTITDANGCTAVSSFTLTQLPGLTVSAVTTNVTCTGGTDGVIAITASGGTSPYNYDWADLAGTNNPEDRSGLGTGTYTVTVTDANGCMATLASTLTAIQSVPNPVTEIGH